MILSCVQNCSLHLVHLLNMWQWNVSPHWLNVKVSTTIASWGKDFQIYKEMMRLVWIVPLKARFQQSSTAERFLTRQCSWHDIDAKHCFPSQSQLFTSWETNNSTIYNAETIDSLFPRLSCPAECCCGAELWPPTFIFTLWWNVLLTLAQSVIHGLSCCWHLTLRSLIHYRWHYAVR